MFLASINLDRLGINFLVVFHKLKDFTFPSIKEIILINLITSIKTSGWVSNMSLFTYLFI